MIGFQPITNRILSFLLEINYSWNIFRFLLEVQDDHELHWSSSNRCNIYFVPTFTCLDVGFTTQEGGVFVLCVGNSNLFSLFSACSFYNCNRTLQIYPLDTILPCKQIQWKGRKLKPSTRECSWSLPPMLSYLAQIPFWHYKTLRDDLWVLQVTTMDVSWGGTAICPHTSS